MTGPLIEVVNPRVSGLAALERGATAADALAFFDSLPPMPAGTMISAWRGSGLRTGHRLEGLLEVFGWYGKRFEGPEAVHPLVFGRPGALFSVDPAHAPLGLIERCARVVKARPVAPIARGALEFFRTDKPKARLRTTEFRGVATATMIYDALPIHDIFRKVDADTALGLMDRRGDKAPGYFFFVLRRDGPATIVLPVEAKEPVYAGAQPV
jgi:hypothetical protein